MNDALVDKLALPGGGQLAAQLDRTFKSAWRSYRRAFKRCQNNSSRAAVHRFRVETRRRLALVDLFDPLLAGNAAEGVSRLFKQPFKASGRLRDAQVMLCDMERRLGRFPDAKCFKKELRRREKRLGRQLERKLRRTKLKPLKNRLDALRNELRAAVKKANGRHQAGVRLLKGMDRAFANVVARRRSIAPTEPHATHRTRVDFKKFRYMVEQLRPLMPGLAVGLPDKLRDYQKLMGDIQDCETLLTALDKFMREEDTGARRLRKFRAAVKRDHARLMARYLRRADELFSFWNPSTNLR
ncbi:MAG: CHAD domain-containing protein [Verrucomicrobiota bacterium]